MRHTHTHTLTSFSLSISCMLTFAERFLFTNGGTVYYTHTHTHSLYFILWRLTMYRRIFPSSLLTNERWTHTHSHTSPAYINIVWDILHVNSRLLFVTNFPPTIHYTANALLWILTWRDDPLLTCDTRQGVERLPICKSTFVSPITVSRSKASEYAM